MNSEFSWSVVIGAIAVATVFISVFSLVREPYRQTINALIIAGAGGVYWSGGLGFAEFPLGPAMIFLAYKGLKNYKYLAAGWTLHTLYDLLHHYYASPIIPMEPLSSLGCAICDPLLAIWLFAGAPSIFNILRNPSVS